MGRLIRLGWLTAFGGLAWAAIAGVTASLERPEIVGDPRVLESWAAAGIPPTVAIAVGLALPMVTSAAVALMLLGGRPGDASALVFGLALFGSSVFVSGAIGALDVVADVPDLLGRILVLASAGGLVVLGLLFPDVLTAARPLKLLTGAALGILVVVPSAATDLRSMSVGLGSTGPVAAPLGVLVALLAGLALQYRRYRSDLDLIQRRQVQWVAYGVVVFLGLATLAFVGGLAGVSAGTFVVLLSVSIVVVNALPITVAVAVLRYRLFELDRVVSATIVYTAALSVVGGAYGCAVLLLRTVVRIDGDLAVAASTLAAAAVFTPAVRWLRRGVERRLHRRRFDARRELELLSQRMSRTPGVDDVQREVAGVLERTLEPDSWGIWMRSPAAHESGGS
jgi:hypothetical protein